MGLLVYSMLFLTTILFGLDAKPSQLVGIVGGKNAEPNQFPYMALILVFLPKNSENLFCSGSVISNEWILSAAHCTKEIDYGYIFLGDIRLFKGTTHQIVDKNIIRHQDFSMEPMKNDICVIKIPFTHYTDAIKNVELPFFQEENLFVGMDGYIAGWGFTKQKGEPASILQYLDTNTVMENKKCQRGYYKALQDNQFCVKISKKKSPCYGDSGGPFVHTYPGGFLQIGIISFLINTNCEYGYPVGNTRVTSYLNWISEKTGVKPNSPKYYSLRRMFISLMEKMVTVVFV